MKKILALVLALVMILAVATAFAGTISITPPTNNPSDAANSYEIYKVFDGVGDGEGHMSYKLISGKQNPPDGFYLDDAGNIHLTRTTGNLNELTTDEIAALAAYIANDRPVATATSTGTTVATATVTGDGYYFIKTTTGSLVTVNSTNPDVGVIDKNTVPQLDKTITNASSISDRGAKALAQLGTDIEYTVPITVGKGSINLAFHDKMQTGLTFKGNSNVTVTGVEAGQYTIKETPDTGDDLTITFVDGIAEGTVITVKYLATINAEALTKLENDAYLTYGEDHHTTHKTTETYNAEISVIKYDGAVVEENPKFLEGAGFKLKNSDGKYYHLNGTTVEWIDETDELKGDEHTSAADGKVPAFVGLANGTYTLEESTVPSGYNKAADVSITIAEGNYTPANLQQVAKVANNKGSELPSTGGIGTTIFYVLGGILVIGAAVILVARRKAHD